MLGLRLEKSLAMAEVGSQTGTEVGNGEGLGIQIVEAPDFELKQTLDEEESPETGGTESRDSLGRDGGRKKCWMYSSCKWSPEVLASGSC